MKNHIVIAGPPHPYQRQFQMALLNLAKITSEEQLQKQLKIKKKRKAHD
jgi:hypothetical protein